MPRLAPIAGTSDVSHYFALVAGIVNAFEIAPPPDGDRLPA
jgi:hypothetical protein